jgi:hypothetical protein
MDSTGSWLPRSMSIPRPKTTLTRVRSFRSRKTASGVHMPGGMRSGTSVPRRLPTPQMGPDRGFPQGKSSETHGWVNELLCANGRELTGEEGRRDPDELGVVAPDFH